MLIAAVPLMAQGNPSVPPRPQLPPTADTNDPGVYYAWGVEQLRRDERKAAAAFYWAARLDPNCAGCLYARAIAGLIEDGPRLERYYRGNWSKRDEPRYQAIDSLIRRALLLDPFLYRRLDMLAVASMFNVLGTYERDLDAFLVDLDSTTRAMVVYSHGRFEVALDIWGRMMRRRPNNARLRVDRARTFFLTGRHDSASAMMTEALRIVRQRDADSITVIYESKAAWEYAQGRIFQALDLLDSAQQAHERALIEDLAFAPAHLQLGAIHLQRRDTAAALREFARAVSVADEFMPHMTYAVLLASTGGTDSAVAHLRRAIELEPWAARPRLILGAVLDSDGNHTGAAEAFEGWLARATRSDPNLAGVRARVANLRRP